MKKLLAVGLTALSLGLTTPAFAETSAQGAVAKYTFDKAHTQIFFTVNHLGFSNSTGKFLDFDGSFSFDKTKPEQSSADVVIKTASVNMDDQKWDDHLKGADFFNVEKFPEMTFKTTKVEVTGENTANVTGDLTLLGVTKPVILAVVHNKTDIHPYLNKLASGFSATTTIKRSDFGMNYGLPAVGDDVQIKIEVEGSVQDETKPNQ